MLPYLVDVTLRLASGLDALPESQRQLHAGYFRRLQRPDGGFAGREGESDLYYSGFALRGLALLGQLTGDVADQAGQFLLGHSEPEAAAVDRLSLVFGVSLLEMAAGVDLFGSRKSEWRQATVQSLESLRRADGGYAKATEGQASSTYHTFLIAVGLQLLDMPLVEPERMVDFVLSQQRDDGGFVEIRPMRRSGTNPTAAAIAILKIVDALDNDVRTSVIDFLSGMQTEEGGLRANTRIPIADLLSTFTGALTLADLGALDAINAQAAVKFTLALEQSAGGFRAAAWDESHDVEYTFYGLGTLGLFGGDRRLENDNRSDRSD